MDPGVSGSWVLYISISDILVLLEFLCMIWAETDLEMFSFYVAILPGCQIVVTVMMASPA